MVQGQRRQSQNSLLMRRIIELLREYDTEEIKLLCTKYMKNNSRSSRRRRRSTRRRKPSSE